VMRLNISLLQGNYGPADHPALEAFFSTLQKLEQATFVLVPRH